MNEDPWFWTPEWQAMEREVDEEIARGDSLTFDSLSAFRAYLVQEDDEGAE